MEHVVTVINEGEDMASEGRSGWVCVEGVEVFCENVLVCALYVSRSIVLTTCTANYVLCTTIMTVSIINL